MERPIREAATAICIRDASGGAEILVLERGADSRFLPGYVAFPGGSVDDGDEDHAVRWFGDAAQAHRAAAVRELVEEVGLALTRGGLVGVDLDDPFVLVEAAPPEPGQLPEMAHWVAPPEVPVRFDARYFAVAAPTGLDPSPDGTETAHAWWVSPRTLMTEWEQGHRKLYWPTFITVQHLAACEGAAEMLALTFEPREPTEEEERTLPRSVMEQD